MRQRIRSRGKHFKVSSFGAKGFLISYIGTLPTTIDTAHRVDVDGLAKETERIFIGSESQTYLTGDNTAHSFDFKFTNSNVITSFVLKEAVDAGVPTVPIRMSGYEISDLVRCTSFNFGINDWDNDFSGVKFPLLENDVSMNSFIAKEMDSDIDFTSFGVMFGGVVDILFTNNTGVTSGRPIFNAGVNTQDISLTIASFRNTIKGAIDISMLQGVHHLDISTTQATSGIGRQMTDLKLPVSKKSGALTFDKLDLNGDMLVIGNTNVTEFNMSGWYHLGGTIKIIKFNTLSILSLPLMVIAPVTLLDFGSNDILSLDMSGFVDFVGECHWDNNSNLSFLDLPPPLTTTFTLINGINTSLPDTIADFTGYKFIDCDILLSQLLSNQGNLTTLLVDTLEKKNITSITLSYQNVDAFNVSDYIKEGFSLVINNNPLTSIIYGANVLGSQICNNCLIPIVDLSVSGWVSGVTLRYTSNTVLSSLLMPISDTLIQGRPANLEFLLCGIDNNVDLTRQLLIPTTKLSFSSTGASFEILFPINGSEFLMPSSTSIVSTGSTSLDLSGFQNLNGGLNISGCTDLTSVVLKSVYNTALTSRPSAINVKSCPVMGYINFTGFTGVNTLPDSINLQSNNYTSDIVNHILVDLAALSTQYITGTITIDGSNAVADATSGGFDGLAAVITLINAGWSVGVN